MSGGGESQLAASELRPGDVILRVTEATADNGWSYLFEVKQPRPTSLPTEPYTVIRTGPMRWMKCGLYVHPDGGEGNRDAWMLLAHESQTELRAIQAADLQVQCIYDVKAVRVQAAEFGVEVLVEPRAATAKAVLDRIQQIQGRSPIMAPVYDVVAREFGADE